MKKQFKRVLAVLLTVMLLFSAIPTSAVAFADTPGGNSYYVSTTGDDTTGTGASDAPFATIAAGVAKLAAGDTLIIKEGTYSEILDVASKVGTPTAPITIKGEGVVTVKGVASKAFPTVCSIAQSAYLTVTGINFVKTGAKIDNYILILNNSSNITVSHCTLNSEAGAEGTFRFLSSTDCTLDSTYATGADRITYQWGGTLSDCTFTNNIFATYYGFYMDNSAQLEGCKLYNNIFHNQERCFTDNSLTECVLANNVFYCSAKMDTATNTIVNNAYVSGTKVAPTDFAVSDPKFTDASNGDYSLQAGSLLIGAGSSKYMPERDFTGKLRRAPADVGPYAYNTVYYVDGSAATTGNGAEATPFQTIAEGIAAVNPGDLLIIKAGTYAEPMSIADKGSDDKLPITIRGEGQVTVTGTDYIHGQHGAPRRQRHRVHQQCFFRLRPDCNCSFPEHRNQAL